MGLLAPQPQIRPQMPQMPGMPGGLPNFQAQSPGGPGLGQAQPFMPQQGGVAPQFTLPTFDASTIPQYGHGYEGDVPFSQNTTRRDLFSGFTGPGAHGYPSMWGSSNPRRNMAWDAAMMDDPTAFRQNPNSAATEAAETWRKRNWW